MTAGELINGLRDQTNRGGAIEMLRLLRSFDPLSIEDQLEFPLPMAFDAGWEEVLDWLIEAASRS